MAWELEPALVRVARRFLVAAESLGAGASESACDSSGAGEGAGRFPVEREAIEARGSKESDSCRACMAGRR